MKALIVGAGLAGLTAGVLLRRKGWDLRILDTRNHIGGNCWDYVYDSVHVHAYGPHIFHTNSQRVFNFVNDFGGLTGYLHKVKANVSMYNSDGIGQEVLLSIPYSKQTEQELGYALTDEQIVGLFFRQYSEKMWGRPFDQIPASITGRVPKRRDNFDPCYFTDKYQGMPSYGYADMFNCMMDAIGREKLELGVRQHAWRAWADDADLVVYTGMIDSYYDLEHGRLPYRAIQFEMRRSQPKSAHAVINWCDSRPCTRTTDFSCFYGTESQITVKCDEYPMPWRPDECLVPSYPMRGFPEADDMMAKYDAMNPGDNVVLCGRLGQYKYMNMDQVIADTMFVLEGKLGTSLYV